MPEFVRLTDVAPRDGLQNEPGVIATADKAELVRLLAASGVDEVEVTSFVSPKWVPQLADAEALLESLAADKPAVCCSVLVPNEKGMFRAMDLDERLGGSLIDKVAVFTAASETFSLKNTNATVSETIERFRPVLDAARDRDKRTRGYISCVVRCPCEGEVDPQRVGEVCSMLLEIGVDELDLGDTIGAGTPETITPVLLAAIEALNGRSTNDRGDPTLTLHLHDTYGNAAACVREALVLGVRSFDGAVSGLGGCPFASTDDKRAPGNISTEVLVRTIEEAGYETGVNRAKLAHAGAFAERIVAAARMSGGAP
ncbi:MAG: hydroxymethylglutaryl-CoA lyase [Phycisphaeraceae bacterium]|nr:MAG: hydroxymethylglutaryl-CoA lyase [Phycisphaeraceae bacterium]